MPRPPKKNERNFRRSKARNAGPPPGIDRPKEDIIGMRLNKYISHSGVCSRRQAADHVKNGEVTVNGNVVKEPGYQIEKGDEVRFRGELVQPSQQLVYILLNKPSGVLTTVKDDRGRKTVMDLLGDAVDERVFPVGRLDRDTTGLLLLTNDGDLAKKLTHPSHKMPKVYQATLDKTFTRADLDKVREGIELEDGPAPVQWINFPDERKKKIVTLEIQMGRNRIVRRLFEHLGYKVEKLDRSYFAGLTKKDLPRGFYRFLTPQEITMLRHFSGKGPKKKA